MGYTGEGKDRNVWTGRLGVTELDPVKGNDLTTKKYVDTNDPVHWHSKLVASDGSINPMLAMGTTNAVADLGGFQIKGNASPWALSGQGLELDYIPDADNTKYGGYLIPYDRTNSEYHNMNIYGRGIGLNSSTTLDITATDIVVTGTVDGVDIAAHAADNDAHHVEWTSTEHTAVGNGAPHHAESHNIASHSDTTATGTELNTLTDDSMADTLHRHSELSASDGTPDAVLSVGATGIVKIKSQGLNTEPFQIIASADNDELIRLAENAQGDGAIYIKNAANANKVFLQADEDSYFLDKLGIGTTAPDGKVHIAGDLTTHTADELMLSMEQYTNRQWDIYVGGSTNGYAPTYGPYALVFNQNAGGNNGDFVVTGDARNVILDVAKVGIGVNDPHSTLEVAGAISSATSTFSTTGPTDNVDVAGVNTLFINTASNNVTIGGFANGVAGQYLHIVVKDATGNTTLEHNEAGGSQDIFLHVGADETLTAEYGGWLLVCDGSDWFECGQGA